MDMRKDVRNVDGERILPALYVVESIKLCAVASLSFPSCEDYLL